MTADGPVTADAKPASPTGGCSEPTASGAKQKRAPRLPSRATRWRTIVLILVHLAIAAHLTHWWMTGRTVSPVEPSETMFFLERGEFNAGTVFFLTSILLTAVFGRFVCGWACHIVALQDLCAWLMKKCGVRPRLFRSRLLVWVPLLLGLYMFVWPTFVRFVVYPVLESFAPALYAGLQPLPPLPGWSNHLMTEDFWATFASIEVAIPFIFVCTFGVVYFLGAKGFCTYGCPYGGIFFPADRLAIGRIKANLDVCDKCGQCTAHCTSNVRVHEEIQLHEAVVSPGCMKCMDCVSVCPTQALSYGFARPQLLRRGVARKSRQYDLSWPEELMLALFAVAVFWSVRGVYGKVPMLFAVGIAACLTFLAWKALRLFVDRDVRVHRFAFKKSGRWTQVGGAFALALSGLLVLVMHSAYIKTHMNRAEGNFVDLRSRVNFEHLLQGAPANALYDGEIQELAQEAYDSYQKMRPLWDGGRGLLPTDGIERAQGALSLILADLPRAEQHFERSLTTKFDDETLFQLARVRVLQLQELERVEAQLGPQPAPATRYQPIQDLLGPALAEHSDFSSARQELSYLYRATDRLDEAIALYETRLAEDPADHLARGRLALELLAPAGQREEALEVLAGGLDVPGATPASEEILRDTLVKTARTYGPQATDVIELLQRALARHPDWLPVRRELVLMHRSQQRREEAAALYEEWGGVGEAMSPRASLYYGSDVLLFFGDVDAGRKALDRARRDQALEKELHHDFAGAYSLLLRHLYQRGDTEEAHRLGRELVAGEQPYGAVFNTLCQFLLAEKRGDDAVAFCRDYLARKPLDSHTRAFFALGVLSELERHEEALTELLLAEKYAPRDGFVLADLALAYHRLDQTDDAVATMQRSMARNPHHAQLASRLIELADLAGDRALGDRWREARNFLQRF
ncbi:MAG: 4Fe-4S binding protein [Planctomycetota bacterium]